MNIKVSAEAELILDLETNTTTAATLKVCLDYLHNVALASNLLLPGLLIGGAAEACADLIAADQANPKTEGA